MQPPSSAIASGRFELAPSVRIENDGCSVGDGAHVLEAQVLAIDADPVHGISPVVALERVAGP